MSTISPAELADRVRARGVRMTEHLAIDTLRRWEVRGIAEERLGRWRLTRSGQAMFGGWAGAVDLEDDLHQAVPHASDVFQEEGRPEVLQTGRRIFQRSDEHLALENGESENLDPLPVGGLEAIGEVLVVDQAREIQHEIVTDGNAGEVHGHGGLLLSRVVTGSAVGCDEPTGKLA